jgi:hypothetical protein
MSYLRCLAYFPPVEGLMSYLRCLCIVVSNTYCVVYILFVFVLCTLCCQFPGLSIFGCHFVFSNVYLGSSRCSNSPHLLSLQVICCPLWYVSQHFDFEVDTTRECPGYTCCFENLLKENSVVREDS